VSTSNTEAFRQLEVKEPGSWALGQSAADFFAPRESTFPTRTVEIELFESLPTPPDNVSLSDVLNFRIRRKSELVALQTTIDDLYFEIRPYSTQIVVLPVFQESFEHIVFRQVCERPPTEASKVH
jgi:hypothetical protein